MFVFNISVTKIVDFIDNHYLVYKTKIFLIICKIFLLTCTHQFTNTEKPNDMKSLYTTLFLFTLLYITNPLSSLAQSKEILGYLPYYRFNKVSDIEFEKLTQLNIAFANPTADTSIIVPNEDFDAIIEIAHNAQVKVCISLAGGAVGNPEYQRWIDYTEEEALPVFVHNIMNYCRMHHLDGVDFDLEWNLIEDVGAHYENFVIMMADSLWAEGKMITAAFPGTYRYNALTDICLSTFEQINLMAYDLTGPWDPNNPGPHSPYYFAEQSINYWKTQNVPQEKLLLGVPFYGYDFGGSSVSSFTYAWIVNQNTDNAYLDQVEQKYYNGIPTIKDKAALAKEESNGIMIWELGQDHYGESSLLNAIWEEMQTGLTGLYIYDDPRVLVYPNPVVSILSIKNKREENASIYIRNISGNLIKQTKVNPLEKIEINMEGLSSGIYILNVFFPESRTQENIKIIKL